MPDIINGLPAKEYFSKYQREVYYPKHRESIIEGARAYSDTHPEVVLKARRSYANKHKKDILRRNKCRRDLLSKLYPDVMKHFWRLTSYLYRHGLKTPHCKFEVWSDNKSRLVVRYRNGRFISWTFKRS
jgi:hypothetical protein